MFRMKTFGFIPPPTVAADQKVMAKIQDALDAIEAHFDSGVESVKEVYLSPQLNTEQKAARTLAVVKSACKDIDMVEGPGPKSEAGMAITFDAKKMAARRLVQISKNPFELT